MIQRILGDINKAKLADKFDLVKPVYFFSTFNEKAFNALVQDMTTTSYRYSNTILEYKQPIDRLYIIKSGNVRLQIIKPSHFDENEIIQQTLDKELAIEPKVNQLKVQKKYYDTDYEDIAQRNTSQTFCEEYYFSKNRVTDYRVIVNSAVAVIVTIPFSLIFTTLSTFEMFQDDMKEAIESHHGHHKTRIEKIDLRLPITSVIKTLKTPTTIGAEILKRSLNLKSDTRGRKFHVPTLLQ